MKIAAAKPARRLQVGRHAGLLQRRRRRAIGRDARRRRRDGHLSVDRGCGARPNAVRALRTVGFAAWFRPRIPGLWDEAHPRHRGERHGPLGGRRGQVSEYFRGFDGLAGDGRDQGPQVPKHHLGAVQARALAVSGTRPRSGALSWAPSSRRGRSAEGRGRRRRCGTASAPGRGRGRTPGRSPARARSTSSAPRPAANCGSARRTRSRTAATAAVRASCSAAIAGRWTSPAATHHDREHRQQRGAGVVHRHHPRQVLPHAAQPAADERGDEGDEQQVREARRAASRRPARAARPRTAGAARSRSRRAASARRTRATAMLPRIRQRRRESHSDSVRRTALSVGAPVTLAAEAVLRRGDPALGGRMSRRADGGSRTLAEPWERVKWPE